MKLTDNCINEFQIWAISHEELKFKNILGLFCINLYGFWIPFYILPDVIKYGVFVDFFDSVGIHIEISECDGWSFTCDSKGFDNYNSEWDFKTRQEARTAAIEKANKIYNN